MYYNTCYGEFVLNDNENNNSNMNKNDLTFEEREKMTVEVFKKAIADEELKKELIKIIVGMDLKSKLFRLLKDDYSQQAQMK